jgi:carbon-monoxide dehydrogenase small subunit
MRNDDCGIQIQMRDLRIEYSKLPAYRQAGAIQNRKFEGKGSLMKHVIKLLVNGEEFDILTEVNKTLLEVLREDLGLTGTKRGCDVGACGACTVLIDGKPQLSCLTLATMVQGKKITTIEGLAQEGKLHPLQKAFVEKGAIQCGFCTPGMILTAKAFLDENPHPSEGEVKGAISGNLCRCTGYVKIMEAILSVSENQ